MHLQVQRQNVQVLMPDKTDGIATVVIEKTENKK